MANRQVELRTMLQSLRLPTMAELCADLALKSAKEGLSHEAFLYELARLSASDGVSNALSACSLSQLCRGRKRLPPSSLSASPCLCGTDRALAQR